MKFYKKFKFPKITYASVTSDKIYITICTARCATTASSAPLPDADAVGRQV